MYIYIVYFVFDFVSFFCGCCILSFLVIVQRDQMSFQGLSSISY